MKAPLRDLTPETFPLPSDLRAKLGGISRELHQGRGFVTVRGLDKAAFDSLESTIAFVGVTCHICEERATNRFANLALGSTSTKISFELESPNTM